MRLSTNPAIFRHPVDVNGDLTPEAKDLRPRRYAPEFDEHERALAWTAGITFDHYARFGRIRKCPPGNWSWDGHRHAPRNSDADV